MGINQDTLLTSEGLWQEKVTTSEGSREKHLRNSQISVSPRREIIHRNGR